MQQKDTDIYFSLKKIFSSNPDFSEEQITYFCSKYKVKRTSRNEILLHASEVISNQE